MEKLLKLKEVKVLKVDRIHSRGLKTL